MRRLATFLATSSLIFALGLALLILARGTSGIPLLDTTPHPTSIETLADGTQIQLEDPPTSSQRTQMRPTTTSHKLIIPDAGIDTTLKEMNLYTDGTGQKIINPPTSANPYLVRDYGPPNSTTGMTVIAMHSIRDAPTIPGSKLINIDTQQATITPGALITIDTTTYRVTQIHNQNKQTVTTNTALWENKPGKLLLFTCLQRTQGKSTNNIAIEAQRVTN